MLPVLPVRVQHPKLMLHMLRHHHPLLLLLYCPLVFLSLLLPCRFLLLVLGRDLDAQLAPAGGGWADVGGIEGLHLLHRTYVQGHTQTTLEFFLLLLLLLLHWIRALPDPPFREPNQAHRAAITADYHY
jgi:hypothetical protein